jgi:hypothetical protein
MRACLADRKRASLDSSVNLFEGSGKTDARREIGDRDRHRARSADHDLWLRQYQLDKNVHRALARTHVLGETHAAIPLTGTGMMYLRSTYVTAFNECG